MPPRRDPDAVSPRALARVRGGATVGGRGGGGRDEGGEDARLDAHDRGRHRPLEVPRGPVFELPVSLRGARWVPSRSAVMAVLVFVVLVAVVFGVRVWLAGGGGGASLTTGAATEPTGVSRGTSTLSRASPSGSSSGGGGGNGAAATAGAPGASGSAGGAGPSGTAVVHVVGQVARPGVYRMSAGARVGDAVASAGGASRTADLTAVNLARVLVDGEQIVVPRPGEVVAGPGAGASAGSGAAGGVGAGSGAAPASGTVSLNSADLPALDTLPGVGPVLAQRILDWRTEHGRFTSVEELGEVSGIGEKLLAQLTPKVTL
ncbi:MULTISPECIES: helix-hairpin-helix domain-containing protein [unclassified Knoellia]|uniref:helix-hairpin-helix domain-containing protein n=1 Tax=Knoellia altitudinis TaxID=3404795 RepID=UPI00360EFC11